MHKTHTTSSIKYISILILFFMFTIASFADLDMIVKKTVDQSAPSEGNTIVYTIEVENKGPDDATGFQILDLLPSGVTYLAITQIEVGDYNSTTGIWDIGNYVKGEKKKLKIEAIVDIGTSGTTIVNTASIYILDQVDTNASADTPSVSITVNAPDIGVTKVADDSTPDEGQEVLFTIKTKNVGSQNAKATNLIIHDLLPVGLTYVSGSSTIPLGTTYDSVTGNWSIPELLDNVELTLVLAATVDAGQSGATIVNTASVLSLDQPVEGTAVDTASAILIVNAPDLFVTKTVTAAPYNENQDLIYTITVKNIGTAPASGVVLEDILAAVLTYQSKTVEPGTTYNENNGTWSVGSLAVNADAVLTITVQPQTGTSGTAINNLAKVVELDQNDLDLTNNSASVEIEVAKVDLLLEKSVNDPSPSEGDTIEFSLKLSSLNNTGYLGDATTIVIEDVLPAGLIFSSFTQIPNDPDGTLTTAAESGGTITWNVASMPTNKNITLKFEVTVDSVTAATSMTNTAEITGIDQVDGDRSNNSGSVSLAVNGADLAVTKTVDNIAPNPGDSIIYTIVVTNNGPLKANNIIINDDLPSGVTYQSEDSGGAYTSGTGEWAVGNLDSGLSATLQITATVDAGTIGTSIINTASILSVQEADSVTENNSDTALIAIGEADLGITKTVSAPSVGSAFDEGETVTYTLTATNHGPNDAPLIEVVDPLPTGIVYDSHSGGTYDSVTGIWSVGTLVDGALATLTITAHVDTNTAGRSIINTATVSSAMNEPVDANNTNEANATIQVHGADLAITKTTTATAPIVEGDAVPYVITVTNNGPDDATDINVTDLLPANFVFVSATITGNNGDYNVTTGIWSGISLANGTSATLTIDTTIESGGGITNTASITASSELDSYIQNNTSSIFISALKTFEAGACIIDMGGTTPVTALAPYRLVYDLIKDTRTPVNWIIEPSKSWENETAKVDQADVIIDGKAYAGGPFVVSAVYAALPAAQQLLADAKAEGMQIDCNLSEFQAPVYSRLTSFPRAVLDEANGGIIESAFYDEAGFNNTILLDVNGDEVLDANGNPLYDLYRPDGAPSNLNTCDDIYAMPHADPHVWDQNEKTVFLDYVKQGGYIWAACHSVSSLEGLVDESGDGNNDMNFLSNTALIEWGDHDDGTPPYSYATPVYDPNFAAHSFMQFIGTLDGALQSGSENVYIPNTDGWRSTTTVAVYDPDHPDAYNYPNTEYPTHSAALVAYGRAYGNPDYGMVMYEASHSITGGTEAEDVAAARVYGNYLLQAGIDFAPKIITKASFKNIVSGVESSFDVVAITGDGILSYQWASTCGGTFSNPTGSTTDFSAPLVDETTTCLITVDVYDECTRLNFESFVVIVYPRGTVAGTIYQDTNGNGIQDPGESGIANVSVNVTDTNGGSYDIITNENGNYAAYVRAGESNITIDTTTLPASVTTQTEGINPTTVTVPINGIATDIDGYKPSDTAGTVTGVIYLDLDGNGTQDAGELGLEGVTVTITDVNGIEQNVTTDANGAYSLSVEAGATTINVDETTLPGGSTQTEGNNSTTVTVPEGGTATDIDGYKPAVASGYISGTVYVDTDGDGIQDPEELGLSGVTVVITDSEGGTQTVTTDTNGNYSVSAPEGDANITIDESTLPGGSTQTQGTNPTTVTVANGEIATDIDGYKPSETSGTVTGIVYEDTNVNGTQDAGEPGISGVHVTITDRLGKIQTLLTDANGTYAATVPEGGVLIDIEQSDIDSTLIQTEGTDPTIVTVLAGEISHDVDGFGPRPDLSVTKTIIGVGPFRQGDTVSYTIEINCTNASESNITVNDTPTGLSAMTITASSGSNEDASDCGQAGQTTFPCTINDMDAGETVILTVEGVVQ